MDDMVSLLANRLQNANGAAVNINNLAYCVKMAVRFIQYAASSGPEGSVNYFEIGFLIGK